jgi:hypothetical protein
MRASLPTIRTNKEGFNSLAEVAKKVGKLLFDKIELDLSFCSFFDANMTAPFYAVLSHFYENLNDITLTNIPQKTESILSKNQFLAQFDRPVIVDTYQTTIPFKKFKNGAGEQFSEYLSLHMDGHGIPKMSPVLTKKFRQSLFEIFQNAAYHSQSDAGIFVCGQFYPNKHKLDFTIADAGIGIRDNVRRFLNFNISSRQAIQWALKEGHSTRSGNQPGGIGLKLIKDFIEINKGKIQIASRFGFYEFSPGGEIIEKMENDFNGTCINIEINTNDTSAYYLRSEVEKSNGFK